MPALIARLDAVALWSGRIVGWLIVPMVLSLVWEVVARYFFNAPTVWAYDMTYMTYGAFFMLGTAYTLQRGGHIRTDSLYAGWSVRTQGIVDAVCYLLCFFPPLAIFLFVTWDFFAVSFARGERSVTSPWMPVIYPLKFVLPASCALLLIQGVAELLRAIHAARHGEWIGRAAPMKPTAAEERPSV
jgi:TRAP-type mannitol/chloroaromatic compound transport system permease small subunit